MKLQLIRNATMKIEYAGKTLLTDPMLSAKGAFMPFAMKAKNPTVALVVKPEDVLAGLDGVLVTHVHPDHFDKAAIHRLSRDIPILCQPADEISMRRHGFSTIIPIHKTHTWDNLTLTRTGGKHGKGCIQAITGKVSGFVFQAQGEPTVYWVGDSVLCEHVHKAIDAYRPDIIITHSGGARFPGMKPIIMDDVQTIATAKATPSATIVAIHMEALDHCGVTREMLRACANEAGIAPEKFLIPEDGAILSF